MAERPLCRCCGKLIPKRTNVVFVRTGLGGSPRDAVDGPLHSKADCQRTTNQQVVSVSYWRDRTVRHFSTWDGESYVDEFFCKGSCATRFAYVMARAGHCTNLYTAALAAAGAKRAA